MTNFEYACPVTEQEAVALLRESEGPTAILAGGTDLIQLLESRVLLPQRVVDITRVETLKGVWPHEEGCLIGALTTLEELVESPLLNQFPCLTDVVAKIRAIQIQQNGTLGGDLCHLPNCWFYRKGFGLLAMDNGKSLAQHGDNRYHAIFGNRGPAKFVSASRFAPALIASGAKVRIIGPHTQDEKWVSLAEFYVTPRTDRQGVTILETGQLITHIAIPAATASPVNATYEILETQGLDWPLATCSVSLDMDRGLVRRATIVLGHVAPVPWRSVAAESALVGQPITSETADAAGAEAIRDATPLWNNGYKVQLARTAVKRAILKAAGQFHDT